MIRYPTVINNLFGIPSPPGYSAFRQNFRSPAYAVLTRETESERENADA